MATYVVGDVQGCFDTFVRLLQQIDFDSQKDTIYFAGDLLNRGPRSLSMLHWLYAHEACAKIVLGNHDILAIALLLGLFPEKPVETLSSLFTKNERTKALDWLIKQPLALETDDFMLIHAGIMPGWSRPHTMSLAAGASEAMQKQPEDFLLAQFNRTPVESDLEKRQQLALRVLTTIRTLDRDTGKMHKYSGSHADCPQRLQPWFEHSSFAAWDKLTIFGHWAALGFHQHGNFIAIDTGCVWGGKLSAYCLESKSLISEGAAEASFD